MFSTFINSCLFVAIVVLSYDIQQLKLLLQTWNCSSTTSTSSSSSSSTQRIAWIDGHGKDPLNTYMSHITEMFHLHGYQIISGDQPDDVIWDVMWIHDYTLSNPKYRKHIDRASSRQIINHVPGSGFYSSKVNLATAGLSQGVPQAFQLPNEKEEFVKFANEHPDYIWVQKDNGHRNIKIRALMELDLEKPDSFLQRFIENPLLIDNRKFDIGVYVVITSIAPLRAYIYGGDALLRFCPEDYHPFSSDNVDKYVVADDYTPIWEMSSLKDFYTKQQFGMRASLDAYLHSKGSDPMKIWSSIGAIVAEVFQRKQLNMASAFTGNPFKAKYFELSRFDFIVDEELNVYLMEANMSPNLSSGHFKPNQQLYEQVLMNIFSLVGLSQPFSKQAVEYLSQRSDVENPSVTSRDIRVSMNVCWDGTCETCDRKMECLLCGHCLTSDVETYLKATYLEYRNRKEMMVIRFNYTDMKPLTKDDYLLQLWLNAKCQEDQSFC